MSPLSSHRLQSERTAGSRVWNERYLEETGAFALVHPGLWLHIPMQTALILRLSDNDDAVYWRVVCYQNGD